MNLDTALSHRWLLAQLSCAILMFGIASPADASCGDYLLSGSNLASHLTADPMAADLRIQLPWLIQVPCDQPGCRQSPPQTESLSTIAVDSRGPQTTASKGSFVWSREDVLESGGLTPSNDSLLCGVPQDIFRPPLSHFGSAR